MSVRFSAVDVATMKRRALASFQREEADRWLPSLSLDSFVLVEPYMLVMKFPAMELLPDEGYNTVPLWSTGMVIMSAVPDMMLEKPNEYGRRSEIDFYTLPKRHEVIKIMARATPPAPGIQEVECVATVRRDDEDVTLMVGKRRYRSMPPSDADAPLSIRPSAQSTPLCVSTMMARALTSLLRQETELRNPSLSLYSFVMVGRNVLEMKFPASEFMERDVIDGLSLMRTALEVSRAAWEMTLDEPAEIAYQDVNFHKIFQLPKSHEDITILVHTFSASPTAPESQHLEYVGSVMRESAEVRIMKGSSVIRVPTPPPALDSPWVVNDPAPRHPPLVPVLPIHVAPIPAPVPVPPVQLPIEQAPPRLTRTQIGRLRKARRDLRMARERAEREKSLAAPQQQQPSQP
ncbi:unnamed protein product [Caenorhabditis nigoni]